MPLDDLPSPPSPRRPSGRSSRGPTGQPRSNGDPGIGRRVDPEFPGPILGGELPVPGRSELRKDRHRSRRRRRTRGQRLLRTLIALVLVLVVVVGAGYGYFRYQWGKVHSAACDTCVAAVDGAPYNVLLIGSDSRAGETAAQAQQFGTSAQAGGQRSDTIKIVHVDPQAGTASTLSIPRDTFVTLSDIPASTGLSPQNKINAAFNNGPDPLIKTIESTFGIPISHYVVINFFGVEDAVNALGGINMNFPYEARDRDCSTGVCYNNSGLNITHTGCQTLSGYEALALSRSRYYQYYDPQNGWTWDPTADLGRIERQNLVISATIDKAKGTYNPLRLNSLFGSVAKDISKDNTLSFNDLFDLAERYKAFSGSESADLHPADQRRHQRDGGRRRGGRAPGRRPDDRPVPQRVAPDDDHHAPARRLRQSPRPAGHHHDHVAAHDGAPHHGPDPLDDPHHRPRHHVGYLLRPDPLLTPPDPADRAAETRCFRTASSRRPGPRWRPGSGDRSRWRRDPGPGHG